MCPSLRLASLAALVLWPAVGPALGAQLTARVIVNPERLWQCGDQFFATGGSEPYRILHILADGQPLGDLDLANPADCKRALDYRVTLPADGRAVITVKSGPYSMDAPVAAGDTNRIWAVNVFVDSVWGQLLDADAPAWDAPADSASLERPPGTFANTVQLRISPDRQWQCGDAFWTTGGNKSYEFATITVDGEYLTTYDFADPADCARVESFTRMLPDKGKIVVGVEVRGSRMDADINTRDWDRAYWVNFFVDTAWGEVIPAP